MPISAGKEAPMRFNSATVGRPEGLLSIHEGAALLGLSPHTIRTWLRQQRIAHVRLGRRVLLERNTLQRFVRSHVVEAKP